MKTLVVITGPTAVGKTSVSINLAKKIKAEIISCDSRQLYKELKIGVARPSKKELREIKHYFIGNLSIQNNYNAGEFESDAIKLIKKLFLKNDYVLLVGGSGLFIHAICNGFDDFPTVNSSTRNKLNISFIRKGLVAIQKELKKIDPNYFNIVDINNPQRIIRALEVYHSSGKPYSYFLSKKEKKRDFLIKKICLNIPRDLLYYKINQRVDQMIKKGLIKEAKSLYRYRKLNALQTVGYKELFSHFDGKITLNEAVEKIKINTRRYSKRQITWFKKDNDMAWINSPNSIFKTADLLQLLNN